MSEDTVMRLERWREPLLVGLLRMRGGRSLTRAEHDHGTIEVQMDGGWLSKTDVEKDKLSGGGM